MPESFEAPPEPPELVPPAPPVVPVVFVAPPAPTVTVVDPVAETVVVPDPVADVVDAPVVPVAPPVPESVVVVLMMQPDIAARTTPRTSAPRDRMLIAVLILIRNSSGVRDPMSRSRYHYPNTVDS